MADEPKQDRERAARSLQSSVGLYNRHVEHPYPLVLLRPNDRHNVIRSDKELIRTLCVMRKFGEHPLNVLFVTEDDLKVSP